MGSVLLLCSHWIILSFVCFCAYTLPFSIKPLSLRIGILSCLLAAFLLYFLESWMSMIPSLWLVWKERNNIFRGASSSIDRGKSSLTGIGGVIGNDKGEILCIFSKGVKVKDSDKAEVLAILESLRSFSCSFQVTLIMESDLHNAILWLMIRSSHGSSSFFFQWDIKAALASHLHVVRSANR